MILLSFDVEEFDMPFEYGKTISFEDQLAISTEGTELILSILSELQVKASFFCTANFALSRDGLIRRIIEEGHEVASHGYYHSKFEVADLQLSKLVLEEITGRSVVGYRMARMMPVDAAAIEKAGYLYNSSINPTWLPGRYNNLSSPRTFFCENNVLQLPASVSPHLRLPLFWLSFHNFPMWFYLHLCNRTHNYDQYLNLYFHPWEFINLHDKNKYGFPVYVRRNSGDEMLKRMKALIVFFKKKNIPFSTISDFLKIKYPCNDR